MTESTILLVEDEVNSIVFFEYALGKLKITNPLQIARDGIEALEYIDGTGPFADRQKYPLPGLVLLDLRLPRATGFEVLQHVRVQPKLQKLIIVVFTASASEEDISKSYALGANAYLVKPSRLEDLVNIVEAIKGFWLTYNHSVR